MSKLQDITAPGQMIDVGGYGLHFHVRGAGMPAVVFESALGGSAADWWRVAEQVALTTQAVTYDRAGHGFSDYTKDRRTPEGIIADLRAGLAGAGIVPPYVLVGHSLGAMHMRYFAENHPDEVAGLVLVDPAHIEMFARLPEQIGMMQRGSRRTQRLFALIAGLGCGGLVARLTPKPVYALPGDAVAAILAMQRRADYWRVLAAENKAAQVYTQRPSAVGESLGDLPLAIVSAGASFDPTGMPVSFPIEEINDTWRELQAEIALLSSDSHHSKVEGASHLTLLYEPHFAAQVADAILALVRRVMV